MTCIKAQSMITPFINNKLNIQEMEEFLDHVDSCPNCMEELEFYYALLTAMKQLDEDKILSNNFRLELSGKIKKSKEKIVHVKYTYFRKKAILILLMILLAFSLGIHYAEKSVENVTEAEKSEFRMKMIFHNEKNEYFEKQLQTYFEQQGAMKAPFSDVE